MRKEVVNRYRAHRQGVDAYEIFRSIDRGVIEFRLRHHRHNKSVTTALSKCSLMERNMSNNPREMSNIRYAAQRKAQQKLTNSQCSFKFGRTYHIVLMCQPAHVL